MIDRGYTIYTHNGCFHPDELYAIALLKKYFGNIVNIVRTRDENTLIQAFKDPYSILVDVGKKASINNLAFDHHQQDMNLAWSKQESGYLNMIVPLSSTGLVYRFLKKTKRISLSRSAINRIQKEWIIPIDAADNGLIHFDKNSFVFSYNREYSKSDEQFFKALSAVEEVLDNIIYNASRKDKINEETIFSVENKRTINTPFGVLNIAFCKDDYFNPSLAYKIDNSLDFYISSNDEDFNIRSFNLGGVNNRRDFKYLIPKNYLRLSSNELNKKSGEGKVKFLHKDLYFVKISGSLNDAIEFAKNVFIDIKRSQL